MCLDTVCVFMATVSKGYSNVRGKSGESPLGLCATFLARRAGTQHWSHTPTGKDAVQATGRKPSVSTCVAGSLPW